MKLNEVVSKKEKARTIETQTRKYKEYLEKAKRNLKKAKRIKDEIESFL